jgi:cardiolipin synthase
VTSNLNQPHWYGSGREFFPAMLAAIGQAQSHIVLEMYIFADDETGRKFLQALTAAAKRDVQVRVLVDSFGSLMLPGAFFAPLTAAGGMVKFFNPLRFSRFGVRDHRKLLVCDRKVIFIGGANISDDYAGDGVTEGWFDTMTRLEDAAMAMLLVTEFERMFTNAEFEFAKRRRLRAFRPLRRKDGEAQLIPEKPGRNAGSFQRALQKELASARTADLITPYFLPRRRLRRELRQIVKRGGRVCAFCWRAKATFSSPGWRRMSITPA